MYLLAIFVKINASVNAKLEFAKMKIKLQKVNKYYYDQGKSTKALENISLEFETDGSFVVITGESGAGKSSLIKVITGIEDYDEGEMFFDDIPTSSMTADKLQRIYSDNISFVFQDYNLVESISPIENINLALLKQGKTIKEATALSKEALANVDLEAQMNLRVSHLSGGERQRVAIARSLALDTPIIVFDEPTGNLDSETSESIIDLIEKISKDKLILYVTHDYDNVKNIVTRHIVLSDGHVIKDAKVHKKAISGISEKRKINSGKFPFISYLYSTYLLGFKRIGRLISTFLVLLFAYAGILGSFYGYANGIILSNNTLSSITGSYDNYSYNMGNEIYNRKDSLDELELSFDAEHFTDYGRDLDNSFSIISENYNNSQIDDIDDEQIDSIYTNPKYMSSIEVTILPFYEESEDVKLIAGTDESENYVNMMIPDYIDQDSSYFKKLYEIYKDTFTISTIGNFYNFAEEDLELEYSARPETRITGIFQYDSDLNSTGNIYLICNSGLLTQIKTYIQYTYSSLSTYSLYYNSETANSKIDIYLGDEKINGNVSLVSYDITKTGIDKLYLSKNLENKDISINYANLTIPSSYFNIEYIESSEEIYSYQVFQPAIDKLLRDNKISSTSYFPTAEIAKEQYEKYKENHPRLYCQEKTNSNYVNYDLNILNAYAFARVGYLSLFALVLVGITLIAFLIKSIINRFYYRKSYDQMVLKYIGYSSRDIVLVNLIEFLSLSIISTVAVFALFLNFVPNAFLIFSANIWMLILAIIINFICGIFFALPKRKRVK